MLRQKKCRPSARLVCLTCDARVEWYISCVAPGSSPAQEIKVLELSGRWDITTLPEGIGLLKALNTLYLYNSAMNALPDSIGKLQGLENLYLGGNTAKLEKEAKRLLPKCEVTIVHW